MNNNTTKTHLEQKVMAAEMAQKHLQQQCDILTQENQALQDTIANQDKLSNLRAWGVDRAISMLKGEGRELTFEQVQQLAEELALYTYGTEYAEMTKGTKQ